MLQLWSDKANLTKSGNTSYYPLSCVILNVDHEHYREQWPTSMVAFLPIIEHADVPQLTDREFYLYKAEIEAACFDYVLDVLDTRMKGFRCFDASGVERNVVCVLHSWLADFVEQLVLAGLIGHTGCALCDVEGASLLLPSTGEVDGPAPAPRSAASTAAALESLRAAWAASRLTEFDDLRAKSRLQGATPILHTLYNRGFLSRLAESGALPSPLVPASIMPLDTLHVFEEGLTKYVVQMLGNHVDRLYGKRDGRWLTDTLTMRFMHTLALSFVEKTKWPDPWRVFRGKGKKSTKACSGLQACEMRAVLQILPPLLLGIHGSRQADGTWQACKLEDDYVTDTVCTFVNYYMELKRYNRPPGHTASTLEMLEHLGAQVVRLLRLHFLDDQKSRFEIPKAHQGFGPHVRLFVESLGAFRWLTTEWGENSVKFGHAAYEATNKQKASAQEQMAAHMARAAAVRHNMASMGLTAAPPRLGARRTAGREAESTGHNTLALTDVVSVPLGDFRATPLRSELVGRPGMAEFPAELRRFLGTQHDNLTYVSLVNSAVLNAKVAHAPDEYLSTSTHTVYAAPEFRRRRRLSFVALEGRTQDAFTEEWIAQLLLLFRLPDGTELAYVQFLVEDEERAGIGPLFGNPGCAPLVWERVGVDERYSYAVTPLDTLIRREFIVPDLSNVFAMRRSRKRRGQGARVRSTYSLQNDRARRKLV